MSSVWASSALATLGRKCTKPLPLAWLIEANTRAVRQLRSRSLLDRDGYVVVVDALDKQWVTRLRRAFEVAPIQASGTQHVDIADNAPEVESWRALEYHATRVVPGSHLHPHPIPKALAQPLARHPDEIILVGRSGSALMLNGHLLHSGRRNDSKDPRRAVQMVVWATAPASQCLFASAGKVVSCRPDGDIRAPRSGHPTSRDLTTECPQIGHT